MNPFAAIVSLALRGSRAVERLNRESARPERFPGVFLDKIETSR
jgi:hypothetical protein